MTAGAPRVWRPGMPTEAPKAAPVALVPDPPEPSQAPLPSPWDGTADGLPDPLTAYLARSFPAPAGGVRYAKGERLLYGGRFAAVAAPEAVPDLDLEMALPDRGAWEWR